MELGGSRTLEIGSLAVLKALAGQIARAVPGGALIGLTGPLGAGKTEFVRAFARGAQITEEVTSPTFVLEASYEVPHSAAAISYRFINHWDLYRLAVGNEFESEIGELAADPDHVVLVEWPERVPWVYDLLDIEILLAFPRSPDSGDEMRVFEVRQRRSNDLFAQVANCLDDFQSRIGSVSSI